MLRPFFQSLRLFLALLLLFWLWLPQLALAATLTSLSDTLSNTSVNTSATHTVAFTTASSSPLGKIAFQFSTASGGSTMPAHLVLTSATLGTVTGLPGSWSLNTGSAGTGLLSITNSAPSQVTASTAVSVDLQSITNSATGDCTSTGTLTDICYVNITTYAANGSTVVDTGTTSYEVYEDPTLTFTVSPIAANSTNNGITTTAASTATTLPFGHIAPGQAVYIAQQLEVATNAPGGYTVNAYLAQSLTGSVNSNNTVSPFGATNATWSTPQPWSVPTGSSSNSNSGWFGANTSDSRVSGWSGASAKFGPISPVEHPVDYSSSSDRSGTVVVVTYGLEVNALQPSDIYSGILVYNVEATY